MSIFLFKKIINQSENSSIENYDLLAFADPDLLFNHTANFNSYSSLDDGIFHKVNNDAERILGFRREELLGKSSLELNIWVDAEERRKTIEQIKLHGKVNNWEAQFRKKDGSIICGRYSVTKLGNFAIFNVQDITEEKLRIQQEQAKDDNSHNGILTINSANKILFANKKAREVLEFSEKNALINHNMHDLISDFSTKISTLDQANRKLNNQQSFESLIKKSDGKKLLCKINISWFTNSTGNSGAYVIFKDITNIIISDKNLFIAKAEAEAALNRAAEANKAKDQFLANMSHEIRNPLQSMVASVERALSYIDANPNKAKEYLNIFSLGLKNLSGLVNNILDFSKIENTSIKLKNEPFSLQQLLADLTFYKLEAENKGIDYAIKKSQDLPDKLHGDKQRLHEVLSNLLSNAFKFTEYGSINLDIEFLSQENGLAKIFFQIRDTGIGIDADNLDKLFNPFTQVDSSYTKKYKGTGLGLSITKEIISAMGGSIGVTSSPGKGSSFHFALEFKLGDNPKQTTSHRISSINEKDWPSGALEILVVEDDPWIRLSLLELLSAQGYKVTEALDGAEAIELSKTQKYNVIFMDGGLPKIDGFEASRNIRKDPGSLNNNTHIIFNSAYTEENEMALVEDLNVLRLHKPYNQDDVRITMSKLFS